MHQLVEAQAARTPDAIAVVHRERRLSYAELDDRADRLAARLHQRGVTRGAKVGICAERSSELVIALLGVLKAGRRQHTPRRRQPLVGGQDTFRLSPSDRVLQKTPYSFDVSVWEFTGR